MFEKSLFDIFFQKTVHALKLSATQIEQVPSVDLLCTVFILNNYPIESASGSN